MSRRRPSPTERAVEAMLDDRRPAAFGASDDDARLLAVAARLRAGRPGADLPRPDFVDSLERRLRVEAAGTRAAAHPGRRAFLRSTGLAAAAVAAGVGIDRAVVALRGSGADDRGASLVPDHAGWVAVATLAEVTARGPLRFSSGGVEGVLVARDGGSVDALSAVCTHMGCLLRVDAAAQRLRCPCHLASFTLDGAPVDREYLAPLPRLDTRVRAGSVEVRLPPSPPTSA